MYIVDVCMITEIAFQIMKIHEFHGYEKRTVRSPAWFKMGVFDRIHRTDSLWLREVLFLSKSEECSCKM